MPHRGRGSLSEWNTQTPYSNADVGIVRRLYSETVSLAGDKDHRESQESGYLD